MNTVIELNLVGPTAALVTFLSIWIGHTAVRKIEYAALLIWPPAAAFSTLGLALIGLSLWATVRLTSTVLAILGITLLWDAFELFRQADRVRKGHAPANPRNPRHASSIPGSSGNPFSRQGS